MGDRWRLVLGSILGMSTAISEIAAAASSDDTPPVGQRTSSRVASRGTDAAKLPFAFDSSQRVVGEAALGSLLGIGGIVGGVALGAGTRGSLGSALSSMLILGSVGGFSGVSLGVWGGGELSDGQGNLATTAFGTVGGIVAGGLLALPIVLLNQHSDDQTPGTAAACVVFLSSTLTGSIFGYELSQPGHRSRKALLLPVASPSMAGVTLVGTLG